MRRKVIELKPLSNSQLAEITRTRSNFLGMLHNLCNFVFDARENPGPKLNYFHCWTRVEMFE